MTKQEKEKAVELFKEWLEEFDKSEITKQDVIERVDTITNILNDTCNAMLTFAKNDKEHESITKLIDALVELSFMLTSSLSIAQWLELDVFNEIESLTKEKLN